MDPGFGTAMAERTARRMLVAIGIVFAIGIVTGFVGMAAWLNQSPKPAPPTPIVVDWDAWIIEHRKTCPTCQRAWDTADSAMCEEAFAKLQEELKK